MFCNTHQQFGDKHGRLRSEAFKAVRVGGKALQRFHLRFLGVFNEFQFFPEEEDERNDFFAEFRVERKDNDENRHGKRENQADKRDNRNNLRHGGIHCHGYPQRIADEKPERNEAAQNENELMQNKR